MGKHNSKLKSDTLDKLTAETYCKCFDINKFCFDLAIFFTFCFLLRCIFLLRTYVLRY